jgi:hypothetical protein
MENNINELKQRTLVVDAFNPEKNIFVSLEDLKAMLKDYENFDLEKFDDLKILERPQIVRTAIINFIKHIGGDGGRQI